jgi:hypothetical protein
MDDFYVYPDGHGNICAAAIPELNLTGLNQPFADPHQGMEIMAGIWRTMSKVAKDLEVMQNAQFKVGDQVLIDQGTPALIDSTWGDGHFKVETKDGVKQLVKAGRLSRA